MATLTPQQQTEYFKTQGSAASPLSPSAWLAQQAPVAQAPTSPAPQMQAPAVPAPAPTPAPTVTINNAPQAQPTQSKPQPAQTQQTGQLTYDPAKNPSVVDLLNMAGQDTSFSARQNLAKQYGISNYTGTAQQNIELGKKFTDAFNALKQQQVPETGATASTALDQYFDEQPEADTGTPEQQFFDAYSSMNPVVANIYDTLLKTFSSIGTRETFTEEFKRLRDEQGIEGLNTELMNIKNVMEGTEDDIRTEIMKVGGFATESQVQALTGARNKTLLKQATLLSDQLQMRNDYIDQVVRLSGMDRAQVEKDVDRKLGIVEKVATLEENMTKAAKENYQKIVDSVGYSGLAQMVQGNKEAQKNVERVLSLPQGALSNNSWLGVFGKPKTTGMASSIQEYEYAKEQGYKGTFNQYQTEDANRKAKIAGAGVVGLTAAQINQTVNQIAGAFDNEQTVKDYNQAASSLRGVESIGVSTKSPTDDMAFIYAFAKIMDPNSVVREGEYKTVQEYGQALVQKAGLNLKRITDNSNFLTTDAKQKMLTTLQTKVAAMKKGYDQVASEYQRQINDAYAGKPRQITNYTTTIGSNDAQITQLKKQLEPGEILVARETRDGKRYMAIMPNELLETDITF